MGGAKKLKYGIETTETFTRGRKKNRRGGNRGGVLGISLLGRKAADWKRRRGSVKLMALKKYKNGTFGTIQGQPHRRWERPGRVKR